MHDDSYSKAKRRAIIAAAAVVTLGNLVVLAGALFIVLRRYEAMILRNEFVTVDEDAVFPLIAIALCQAAISGLALVLWPPSRSVGAGILIGTMAAAIAGAVGFYFLLISKLA